MGLRWRLLGGYWMTCAVAFAALHVWTTASLRDSYLALLQQQLGIQLKTLAATLDPKDPQLDALVDRAAAGEGNRITLMDDQGRVLADSEPSGFRLQQIDNRLNRTEVQQALQHGEGSSLRYSTTVDRELLYVARRLPGGGVVRVAASLDWVENQLASARRTLMGLLGVLLVVGSLLLVGITRGWVASLQSLEQAAAQLTEGNTGSVDLPSGPVAGGLATRLSQLNSKVHNLQGQLEAERDYLKSILSSIHVGVLVVAHDTRVIYTNPAFEEMFGLSRSLIDHQPLELIRQPPIQDAVSRAISQQLAVSDEVRLNGRTLEIHVSPIRPPAGRAGVVAMVHDISELRRLEKVRQDFVSNVSHELRTPLTSIQGYSETLAQEVEGLSPTQRSFVDKLARNAAHLGEIVQALLDLSRLEQGGMSPQRERIAADELVAELKKSWRDSLQAKGLKWRCEVHGVTTFSASLPLLQQALNNLLENALNHTDQGEIGVRIAREGDGVRIDVLDTGVGIPESEQARVFERFYRASRVHQNRQGSGIGLSIVKHIVALHGGSVWLESQVGKGTQVSFTLPQNGPGAGTRGQTSV